MTRYLPKTGGIALNLIYDSLNSVCIGVFIFSFIVYKLLVKLARKKGPEFSKKLLVAITGIAFVLFFVYKFNLSKDIEYASIEEIANTGGFEWGAELPLALCNLTLWLVPLSLIFNIRPIQGFCFIAGPLGAIFAIMMPCAGFYGYSIFLPRVFFYLLLHYIAFWGSIALYTTGLYRPTKKDVLPVLLTLVIISLAVFIINNIIMLTGFAQYPNYLFTMFPSPGNPILEGLYKLIPIRYVYELPLMLVLALYMLGLVSLMDLKDKKKAAMDTSFVE